MSNPQADRICLCATQRLARNLQLADARAQAGQGRAVWPTLQAFTVDAWLGRLGESIALSGEAPSGEVPSRVLTPFEEGLAWRRVIEAGDGLDLFDLDGLARSAAEAHQLLVQWHLRLDAGSGATEELRRFLAWRQAFLDLCRQHDWVDRARYRQHVCDWIRHGRGALPARIDLVGFDVVPPQLRRLSEVLGERGVAVRFATAPDALPPEAGAHAFPDAEAECRAAARWACAHLAGNPDARLGIVAVDLEARRTLLVPILDAELQPDLLRGASDAAPTSYNLSLGLPLARHGVAAAAVELLHALTVPRGWKPEALGTLLRQAYWGNDLSEADVRARLDAWLRERPGQILTLGTAMRLTRALKADARLLHTLHAFAEILPKGRGERLPSAWAEHFAKALETLGWPGERSLSSTEFQARAAFLETLDELASLDDLLGSVPAAKAVGELRRLCAETIFQPKTPGQPPVQVLGMLEAGGAQFDALWVMGMNDDRWPPPPRPNPLLPAEMQRRHATPGASAEVQAEFARKLQADLMRAAPYLVFSYAEKEGDRALRPSPLLRGITVLPAPDFGGDQPASPDFEMLDDALAPPVGDEEEVSGGSTLLKAQALCPAWAYYRYRLGAQALSEPDEGLDAAQRGTLVHALLEAFWKTTGGLAGLTALQGEALDAALVTAAEAALVAFEKKLGEPLLPVLRSLEARRLVRLGRQWLAVEGGTATVPGRAPFIVEGCEVPHVVQVGRLHLRLVIDRIDILAGDGRKMLIDYKTGGKPTPQQWLGERITEPQLPLYAACVLAEAGRAGDIAAVAFAKVKAGACAFAGLAVADGLLPGVRALETEGEASIEGAWQALIARWRSGIEMLAEEIRLGVAAVRFADERDLDYCEVRPLLRLAERRQQFERHRQADRTGEA